MYQRIASVQFISQQNQLIMKLLWAAGTVLLLGLFSCGNPEELEKLQSENEQLKKEVRKLEHQMKEERKLAKYAREEAETAKRRTEEILKDCEKK